MLGNDSNNVALPCLLSKKPQTPASCSSTLTEAPLVLLLVVLVEVLPGMKKELGKPELGGLEEGYPGESLL